jgi:hypothetical protein
MDRPYIFSRDDAQIKEFSLYIFRFSWTAVRRNGWLGIVNGYRYRGMNLRREPVASYISIRMQVAWGDTAKPAHHPGGKLHAVAGALHMRVMHMYPSY